MVREYDLALTALDLFLNLREEVDSVRVMQLTGDADADVVRHEMVEGFSVTEKCAVLSIMVATTHTG